MRTLNHAEFFVAIALCAGCSMTEYNTHSLGTTPLIVPGPWGNTGPGGSRPRPESGDAYHGRSDTATIQRFETMVRRDGRKLRIDGYSCSCSWGCRLKGAPFRTGAWGFGATVPTAHVRASAAAADKCRSRRFRTNLGLTLKGVTIDGSLRCDSERQCVVHYTEID